MLMKKFLLWILTQQTEKVLLNIDYSFFVVPNAPQHLDGGAAANTGRCCFCWAQFFIYKLKLT